MFAHPWFLSLLLLVPLAAWSLWSGRRRSAVTFSSTAIADDIGPTLRQRFSWLPSALALFALVLMILSLARPREGRERTIIESEGIAIEMVVDRSGSMQAMDFKIDGQRVDRLAAIKNVAADFVLGNQDSERQLDGRASDLVGLIAFAGYADAISPPTLDHTYLTSQLNKLAIVQRRSEDGTAIGDAISLAVEKLNTLDDDRDDKQNSKVIILLTDGENTAGEFDPLVAAELAEKMDVRIYTIGVGTRGQAPVPVPSPLTGRKLIQWMQVNIDEETLRGIAKTTGGKYFRATDTDSLIEIYAEIDQLEKAKIESQHVVNYRELAIQPFQWAGWNVPPLVLIAIFALVARLVLGHTIYREFS